MSDNLLEKAGSLLAAFGETSHYMLHIATRPQTIEAGKNQVMQGIARATGIMQEIKSSVPVENKRFHEDIDQAAEEMRAAYEDIESISLPSRAPVINAGLKRDAAAARLSNAQKLAGQAFSALDPG